MESERHVGGEIHRLSHLFKRRLDDGMPQETTGMQARIIGFLRFHEGRELFQRDVEAEFGIRRSTATGILQLMEKNGYLIRLSAPDDARMKNLVLTAKGIESQKRMKERLCRFETLLSSGFSPEELQYLEILLKRLGDNIK